jgi:monofunctional biosynthetic peptidoglycan transglycosylase
LSRKAAKPKAAQPKRKGSELKPRSWAKWLAVVVLGLLGFPILQVGCVRVAEPRITPLMLLRPLEARWSGIAAKPRVYRWIDRAQIPTDFLRCVLAAEDQRFFEHRGFDWTEMRNARRQAEKSGRAPRGASTVTMQCARSLFLWQGRSWVRKGIEAYYTFWMETLLSKQRILELYANVIEMGDGIYGLEAAAQTHFGIPARALAREQCAMLTAILPNPRRWNPREPTPKLRGRSAMIRARERMAKFPQLH